MEATSPINPACGPDIRFIQQFLGQAKLETTQIYTEVSVKQLRDVHRRTHPSESKTNA